MDSPRVVRRLRGRFFNDYSKELFQQLYSGGNSDQRFVEQLRLRRQAAAERIVEGHCDTCGKKANSTLFARKHDCVCCGARVCASCSERARLPGFAAHAIQVTFNISVAGDRTCCKSCLQTIATEEQRLAGEN
jgi:hypothetical protein